MNDSPNDDRDPIAGDADRTRTDRLAPAPDVPIGLSGILPVGGTLSATPGSLMGEGGGYGSPLGGATLYPVIAPLNELEDAEDEIATGVEDAIAEDGRLSPNAISALRISASVHTVRLEGQMPTETERHIAEEIARHVPGVRAVENLLTVEAH